MFINISISTIYFKLEFLQRKELDLIFRQEFKWNKSQIVLEDKVTILILSQFRLFSVKSVEELLGKMFMRKVLFY